MFRLARVSRRALAIHHQDKIWADKTRDGFSGTVGKTPLIRLKKLSEETGCNIVVKAEHLNPGQSVKDRAALFLVKDAEERGLIQPGGTIVEGTAGNTGIGLAHICNAKGYKCVIYMPNNQSQEKIDALRMLGAVVRPVPVAPFTDPQNYNHQAKRFADETPNAYWSNQFDNVANRRAHYETTGPELWEQTGGQIHAFTCATGTGGTLSGVSRYLKEKSDGKVKIVLADPPGSVLFNYIKKGVLEREGTGSITEGIGQGRVTSNLQGAIIDDALHINDEKSLKMVFRMLLEEGLLLGASSGLNITAAYEIAQQLGPGHTVATLICDNGSRYATRLFNKAWLQSKGLLHCVPESHQQNLM